MTPKRRRYPADEIVRLLRQHLINGVPVPEICRQNDLHPTIFYRWQRELFRRAHTAFQRRFSIDRVRGYHEKVRELRVLLRGKDRELSALKRQMEGGRFHQNGNGSSHAESYSNQSRNRIPDPIV
jgi:transposase